MKNLKYMNLQLSLLIVLFSYNLEAQKKVITEDLTRFYQVFEVVIAEKDSNKQIALINTKYTQVGSQGLKEFMVKRQFGDQEILKYIFDNIESLKAKKPWILSVLDQKAQIEKHIKNFKKIYPDFSDDDIYFCVGAGISGGTIDDKTVYIGTEVLASEYKNWAVHTVVHEYVHTQQWVQKNMNNIKNSDSLIQNYIKTHTQLLGQCIMEGMADFVAELVQGQKIEINNPNGHTAFGVKNEKDVWEEFKKDMQSPVNGNTGWLYSEHEIKGKKIRDLGYFVGHQICKSYYVQSINKTEALREMLSLDLNDENSKTFLNQSKYEEKLKY